MGSWTKALLWNKSKQPLRSPQEFTDHEKLREGYIPRAHKKLLNCIENRIPGHMMAYVYAACPIHVIILSIGSKLQPVSNFTELHALTLAARSYALLYVHMWQSR